MKLKSTLLHRGRHKLPQVTTGRSHTCMHPVMSLVQEFLCTTKARVRLTCPSTTFNLNIKLTPRTTADGASTLGAGPGADQSPEVREAICCSHLIWEAVPHPGHLKSEGPLSICSCFDCRDSCCIFIPEIVNRLF